MNQGWIKNQLDRNTGRRSVGVSTVDSDFETHSSRRLQVAGESFGSIESLLSSGHIVGAQRVGVDSGRDRCSLSSRNCDMQVDKFQVALKREPEY